MNIKIIIAMLFSRPHKRYNWAIKTEKTHVEHLFEYARQMLYTHIHMHLTNIYYFWHMRPSVSYQSGIDAKTT